MVVHTSSGSRAGCGILGAATEAQRTAYGRATLGNYPGTIDSTAPDGFGGYVAVPRAGALTVQYLEPTGELQLTGVATGLEPSVTGGLHIHTGYSCSDPSLVGGHYYDLSPPGWTPPPETGSGPVDGPPDPWVGVTYTTDEQGVARISTRMAGFSLADGMPVVGRAVVLHDGLGARVGCGLIAPKRGVPAVVEEAEEPSPPPEALTPGSPESGGFIAGMVILGLLGLYVAYLLVKSLMASSAKRPAGAGGTQMLGEEAA